MTRRKKQKRPVSKKTSYLNDYERKKNTRELGRRVLIVCEDDKSAPAYFRALLRAMSLAASEVEVVGSAGRTQPAQVVEAAVKRKEAAEKSDSAVAFDEVWCVIDGDYRNKVEQARNTARKQSVEMAITTPCFEHWIVLHYEDYDKMFDSCDDVVSHLRKHVPAYSKGACNYADAIKNVECAVQRSMEQRNRDSNPAGKPEDHNPCSELHNLMAVLDPKKYGYAERK